MVAKVEIGKTGLFVNPVGIGTNAVGGHNIFPNLSDETGKDIVRTAYNNGIDFLDTAHMYGPGRSEELIGEVIKENRNRHEIVLATKGAHKVVDGQFVTDNSPSFLRETVENSLRRLQTEYIDLFYIHYPDEKTPKEEAIGALHRLKEEGKIRAIGVSNFTLDQLKEGNQDGYIDVLQSGYNLLKRDAENDFLPYTIEHNISFIPYFPLASGLLTGKFDKNSTIEDGRSKNPLFQGEAFVHNLEKVEQLRQIANEKNVGVSNVVLAWYLAQRGIDVIIPGAKKPEQVLANLKTLEVKLSLDEIAEIDRIFN
ncbi:aldo/keto reductase [Psychrobacillus sp. OK032]|uniref:aldo/keto reductase n=1 Tax=Psychrobacillus sp. OK032 TaxID=1884358 RepID=UPI0008BAA23B|nr:aldo/keto reductase [Psychrobacillus sp. OK032]SES10340.1 Predicted oxidoreductase [Psychrobacillus sp. OK032]